MMKFLCDVHISYKLTNYLTTLNHAAIHVNEILNKSETKDSEICNYADLNDLIVITKDSDFKDFFFLKETPQKLIKINLGNISNQELIEIFAKNIDKINELNKNPNFLLEIDKDKLSFLHL